MKKIIVFLTGTVLFAALLAIPAPQGMTIEAKRAAAVALLMASWWIGEVLPIPATSVIPLALYPILGILSSRETALCYGNENIFLFLGGFFIAMAMQKWNLHRRIALHIIRIVGLKPRRMILGFMVATAFLSMWISNTATTMMMLPIAIAVILQLKEVDSEDDSPEGKGRSLSPVFAIALMLSIAYSASIGGIATLIGTPPNIIFAGIVNSEDFRNLFPGAPDVSFVKWLSFGIPFVLVFLPIVWILLTRVLFPVKARTIKGAGEVIAEELSKLGTMNAGEKWTLTVFVLTALGWMFRKDIDIGLFIIPGWAELLGMGTYVHDSTVAIAGALLLFIIPANRSTGERVLDWNWASRIPWGILLLFGGGFALAKSFSTTGLSGWIGGNLGKIVDLPPFFTIMGLCFMMTFLTELTSNTAVTTIMMPVLAATAISSGVHPFLFMIPAAMSASCAFMLPVATPPNAIVFGSGYITIPRMAKTGLVLNLIGVVLVSLCAYLLAVPIFGITIG
jgi:sodium-dependent dicarboxylate transporter 2/3/5